MRPRGCVCVAGKCVLCVTGAWTRVFCLFCLLALVALSPFGPPPLSLFPCPTPVYSRQREEEEATPLSSSIDRPFLSWCVCALLLVPPLSCKRERPLLSCPARSRTRRRLSPSARPSHGTCARARLWSACVRPPARHQERVCRFFFERGGGGAFPSLSSKSGALFYTVGTRGRARPGSTRQPPCRALAAVVPIARAHRRERRGRREEEHTFNLPRVEEKN